jgi:uncharacterized protein (TIGR00369 family)
MSESRITVAEFMAVLEAGMPSAQRMGFDVVTLEKGHVVLGFTASAADLRPGDTVSGPTLFALADLAMYAAVMTSVGPVPLAVTTDATVHFLRRPRAGRLLARARLLKEGARLVVGDILISPAGAEDHGVMHAVMTYSVPPSRE